MPRAVYRLRTAMRIWISATCLSKSRAINDWPSSFTQCIHCPAGYCAAISREGSFRRDFGGGIHSIAATGCDPGIAAPEWLRCGQSLHRSSTAWQCMPACTRGGFQGFAFLRGGITAQASRAAIASWHLRVSYAPSIARQCMFTCMRGCGDTPDILIRRDLVQKFG